MRKYQNKYRFNFKYKEKRLMRNKYYKMKKFNFNRKKMLIQLKKDFIFKDLHLNFVICSLHRNNNKKKVFLC